MELLFVWINQSENGVFREQGINLSPEYSFCVEKSCGNVVLCEDAAWNKTESVFKNNTIINVTAVVGKNGAGKTTLLKFLYHVHNQIAGMRAGSEQNPFMEFNQLIVIGRLQDDLVVYYNICNETFINTTHFPAVNLKENIFEEQHRYYKEVQQFYDVFRVFFTNSNYVLKNQVLYDTHGEVTQLSLSDGDMNALCSAFFRKLLDLNNSIEYLPIGHSLNWRNDYLLKEYSLLDFQNICDIVYYNKLLHDDNFESYAGKTSGTIFLSARRIIRILDTHHRTFYRKYVNKESDDHYFFCFYAQLQRLFSSIEQFSPDKYIIYALCFTLMFEYCIDKEIDLPTNEGMGGNIIEWLESTIDQSDIYYADAINEISELIPIVSNCEVPDNGGVPRDMSYYKDYLIIDYSHNHNNYKKLVEFLENLFLKGNCFLLRYLVLDNMGMSTGERAFQNLFTRINLIPQLNTVLSKDLQFSDNLLLLIDEMDLYLHPEWQQAFISLMLSEIEKQFKGKRVQIVFSTHSPLLLSDIPNENTVYLRTGKGRTIVDDRKIHQQTFGKDIYSLLKDSFFLENYSMGLYAKDFINRIINEILDEGHGYRELIPSQIKALQHRINMVGNDVVKNKLMAMLMQCSKTCKEYQIQILKEQREELDRKITEMETRRDLY